MVTMKDITVFIHEDDTNPSMYRSDIESETAMIVDGLSGGAHANAIPELLHNEALDIISIKGSHVIGPKVREGPIAIERTQIVALAEWKSDDEQSRLCCSNCG
jgi:hypothetical protein